MIGRSRATSSRPNSEGKTGEWELDAELNAQSKWWRPRQASIPGELGSARADESTHT